MLASARRTDRRNTSASHGSRRPTTPPTSSGATPTSSRLWSHPPSEAGGSRRCGGSRWCRSGPDGDAFAVTFEQLALISAAALLGPVLATPARWRVPMLIGELAAGVALGRTGAHQLHPGDPTFTFLADVGFALVMFVAGSHVPVRDGGLRRSLRSGTLRAAAVGVVAVLLALAIAAA